jgi:flavin reductase (DIM6/NTAB) family NADH-FMN oxidoreductase RutF
VDARPPEPDSPDSADDPAALDGDRFRQLLRRHASGVVVVTAPGDPPVGFTATSFTSVSLDPPMVSFSVARTGSAWRTIEVADVVAVHVLTAGQEHLARTFATSGIDRFAAHGAWREGPGGVPLLDGVLARLVCKVVSRVEAGDHTIVLATPVSGEFHADERAAPLVYHAGRYVPIN